MFSHRKRRSCRGVFRVQDIVAEVGSCLEPIYTQAPGSRTVGGDARSTTHRDCAARRGVDQEAELEAMDAGKRPGSEPVPKSDRCAKSHDE
jgi:hypothetical protein